MYEANRAEFMGISMYIRKMMRPLLKNASSVKDIDNTVVARLFNDKEERTRLHDKISYVVNRLGTSVIKLQGQSRVRVDPDTYMEDIEFLLKKIVSNQQFILRGILADIFLRTLEIVWDKDLGWEDAKGFKFLIRMPTPRSRLVGVAWPPVSGRSTQLEFDSRGIFEGLRQTPEKRYIWRYWQVCGVRYLMCGRAIPYEPEDFDKDLFVNDK